MDATWELLQKRIGESRIAMNDLFAREAPKDAAALDRMAAKADAVAQLVACCRREAA